VETYTSFQEIKKIKKTGSITATFSIRDTGFGRERDLKIIQERNIQPLYICMSTICSNSGPPYWICHFQFGKSDIRFGFRNPKNNTHFYWNPKLFWILIRHIGFTILNFVILASDSDSTSIIFILTYSCNFKNFSSTHFWHGKFLFAGLWKG